MAVGPECRQQHVGRALMLFCLCYYRERGTPVTSLYPFRPHFYRSTGFGYAIKMSRYLLKLPTLPAGGDAVHVRRSDRADHEALHAWYTPTLTAVTG